MKHFPLLSATSHRARIVEPLFASSAFEHVNHVNAKELVMDELNKVPPRKNLLERLEEKHQLPVTIIKNNHSCASCTKPFTRLRRPSAELHLTPEGMALPVLYLFLLCEGCTIEYRRGGQGHRKVRAAVEETLIKEASQ